MQASNHDAQFAARLLDVIESAIVPLTESGVANGNKLFGGAILRKSDLSLVIAGTNNELENPLWHGETHTLKLFYELPDDARPATSDCIFLSTHEPCSLCLSAITWAGFDNFYYLYGYEDTDSKFNIPHDLRILDEVFNVSQGRYQRSNAFWECFEIATIIDQLDNSSEQDALRRRTQRINEVYEQLSETYQASKAKNDIPLA
ncbi:MAG: nucleoside deaminase [Woeseiaceae bacterium]